jgi:hypothetical protein
MLYCNYSNEISRARRLINISIDRLMFIKNRFSGNNQNHKDILVKTDKLLVEYQELDKEVKKHEYH